MEKKQLALLGKALYDQSRVNLGILRALLLIVKDTDSIKADSHALLQIEKLIAVVEE